MIARKAKGAVRLYYELHGAGAPVLLIAGLGCNSQSWQPIIGGLSRRFQAIAFDNRGVGRSSVPRGSYGIPDMAEDALRLLDRLNVRSAHIIGHSLGGYIAQEFAIRYPERVNKLILASTAPLSSARNNLLFERFHRWRSKGVALESWAWAWSFWIFARERFQDRSFIAAYLKAALEYPYPQSSGAFKGQIRAIATHDTMARLKKIRAETLVIEGEEDILIFPDEAQTLAKKIPHCSMSIVRSAGHLVPLEQPKAFLRAVLSFLG